MSGAPEQFYKTSSTTKALQAANANYQIVILDNCCPTINKQAAIANRNVAILHEQSPWILASSWLLATNELTTIKQYQNLGTASLGLFLFDGDWQRSEFQYCNTAKAFCRQSYFHKQSSKLLLHEFFLKPNIFAE